MQPPVGRWREMDADAAARVDDAAREDDAHDAGAGGLEAVGEAGEGGHHEAGVEAVHLDAGGAEAGELDDCGLAEAEAGLDGEAEEVDAEGGEVLAQFAGVEREAGFRERGQELHVQEVDLGEIGLTGILAARVAVLHGAAAVRVAHDAETGEELDPRLRDLAEGVSWVEADGYDLYGDNLGGDDLGGGDLGGHQRGVRVSECMAAARVASAVKGRGKVERWSQAGNWSRK